MDKLDLIHDYLFSLVSKLSIEYDLKPTELNNERLILSEDIFKDINNIIKGGKQ